MLANVTVKLYYIATEKDSVLLVLKFKLVMWWELGLLYYQFSIRLANGN